MSQRSRVSALLAAISGLLFAGLTAAVLHGGVVVRFDERVAGQVMAHQSETALRLAGQLSNLGEPLVSATFVLVATVILIRRRDLARAVLVPVLSAVTLVLVQLLRHAIGRSGPAIGSHLHVGGISYPSGHALGAALAATALSIAAQRWWVSVLALAGALAVAVSRIYLLDHFPSDVLASLLATGVTAGLVEALADSLRRPRGGSHRADGKTPDTDAVPTYAGGTRERRWSRLCIPIGLVR